MKETIEMTAVSLNLLKKKIMGGTPCLVVFHGEKIGHRYELLHHEMLLGRSEKAQARGEPARRAGSSTCSAASQCGVARGVPLVAGSLAAAAARRVGKLRLLPDEQN